jgi:ribosome-associated heat shock protein Hsp15
MLRITRPDGEWEVVVKGLSNQRRGAPEAALLYEETETSRQRREQAAMTREANHAMRDRGMGRPTKRDRRLIKRFNENF